jgi:hypothetical protein
MVDSTTPRARMTHGYRRRIGVIGESHRSGPGQPGPSRTADTSGYRLRPASPARLGPVRHRAHAAVESTI